MDKEKIFTIKPEWIDEIIQVSLFVKKCLIIPKYKIKNRKLREKEYERILEETLIETDDFYKLLGKEKMKVI